MPTKWNIEAEFVQSCNCEWGCPCNFNGRPTYGNCEALVGWKVRKGTFGTTKLDGAIFAGAYWWPKAIHEGNGVSRVYFDSSVSAAQKEALLEILSGKHGGGIFEIFPKTITKTHPPKVAKIDWHYAEYDSWFTVEGVGEVHSEHIRNPVTGDPFEGTVRLPHGIGWKEAAVTNIRRWWMRDEDLLAVHENRSGFVAVVKVNETGPVG